MIFGLSTAEAGQAMHCVLQDLFAWGAAWQQTDVVFTGRRILLDRESGRVTVTQEAYLSELELTSLEGRQETPLTDVPALITDYRSVGALQWLAILGRTWQPQPASKSSGGADGGGPQGAPQDPEVSVGHGFFGIRAQEGPLGGPGRPVAGQLLGRGVG